MKTPATFLSLLLAGSWAWAEQTLLQVSWRAVEREGRLSAGEVRSAGGDEPAEILRLAHQTATPATYPLATIERPAITRQQYAVRGLVRHEDVQGQAYLEMWSVFPDGGRYFSRTLAASGPLRALQGSSPWRDFILPFQNRPGAPPPRSLVLNLVLPGSGTVELGPLRLVEYSPDRDPLARSGAWWSDRTAGLMGGIYGSLVGCFGALIGILVSQGRARAFVVASLKVLGVLGALALAAGLVGVVLRQPYAVYYPLLLTGAIAGVLPLWALPLARRRYEEVELRKLRARDA